MVHSRTKPPGQERRYSVFLVGRIKDGQEDPENSGKSRLDRLSHGDGVASATIDR